MRVLIIGPPGCGKGTQSAKVSADYHLKHISTGDMLRSIAKDGGKLAERIKPYMGTGCLVPDDLIIEMMHSKLPGSYILDGYPRTMKQAKSMEEVNVAVFLSLDEEECVRRIVGRNQGRSDDNRETAAMRYKVYMKDTLPVVKYLKEKKVLTEIAGNRGIEEVYGDIKKVLDGFGNKKK